MELVVAGFGAVTGGLSLLMLLIIVGIYKERIDRHERWFNLLVDESLIAAWKGGSVERGSFISKPETLALFPPEIHQICKDSAEQIKGGKKDEFQAASDLLMKALSTHNPRIADLSGEFGLTPMEFLGVLTTYTVELARER